MKNLVQFLDRETNEVLSRLREFGDAWIVGGWLRDILIEGHPKDNQLDIIPWAKYGFYLSERPMFTADPLFHAGAYYVQEASSMIIEQVYKQHFSPPTATVTSKTRT